MKFPAFILSLNLALFSLFSHAEDIHHSASTNVSAGVESLSPELRKLLAQEMQALQTAMMAIIPAYVSGNWQEIEHIAHKMKNSYILKQKLTDEQIKELHHSLPEAFIKQDKQLHYLAGMLSHVAEKQKPELVGFYFSKLSESCVSCHSQFAAHKFPAFIPTTKAEQHEH